jgi:GT2 family glycosyltransferase
MGKPQSIVPRVSVIIPTKNRATDLAKTIDSLLLQTILPAELILVDQSSEKAFQNLLPIPLKYIHAPGLGGAAEARNVAMDKATGDIWLFLDDDVVLESTFIEQLLNAYQVGVAGVSGVVTNYCPPPLFQRFWETTFMRGPFHDDRQDVYYKAKKLRNSDPIRVRQFGAGLMSFRASVVRDLRFDSNLKGASPGEDIDFCARLPNESLLLMTPQAGLIHNRSLHERRPVHWLRIHAQVSSYMRDRHWREGLWHSIWYFWLNVGYALAATLSCLKNKSLAPWHSWREGAQTGKTLARGNK